MHAETVTVLVKVLVMDMARAPTADEPSQPTMACYGVICPLASLKLTPSSSPLSRCSESSAQCSELEHWKSRLFQSL